ncbi:hypothetical protein C7I55_05145 [Sphingomonas deserti]|uniref:Capsular biosynthesis protein n=1 Tax=Allosphingosinicella deserti TaxID=2116704 RepID=A0A2P7QUN6_9SPHN|nr:hypothetical protein C7I55_05145 [Sphingomonas deserti]
MLFYLPLMTDWFFDDVVKHLLRLVSPEAEVHVAIPLPWKGTGLSEHQLAQCIDLPNVHWHVLDGDDHPSLRTKPSSPESLIDFAKSIAPDYCFCRSADVTTPMSFPGKVKFLMEAAIPPFEAGPYTAGGRITLDGPGIFDRGALPALRAGDHLRLREMIRPIWQGLERRHSRDALSRAEYLAATGLPEDRRIIAVPLDYEGQSNFLNEVHRLTPHNAQLILDLAEMIDDDAVLALTQHPLNVSSSRAMDRPEIPIEPALSVVGDRARIVRVGGSGPGGATSALVQHCDGMIMCDSKSLGYALFFGKPILRLSKFASADWMNVYREPSGFLDALATGTARTPNRDDALTWFGFHYANQVFAVQDPSFTFAELIDRVERPVDANRWEAGLRRWGAA